jgi:hypothetical protein
MFAQFVKRQKCSSKTQTPAVFRIGAFIRGCQTLLSAHQAAFFTASVKPKHANTFITVLIVGFPFGPNAA